MARFIAAGAIAFGLGGAVFGLVWTVFEAPYVMAFQWALGAAVLGWLSRGGALAAREALAAGLVYLVTFVGALFVALTLLEFPAPVAVSAGVTGLAAGAVLSGSRGAWRVGLAAFAGFALGEIALAVVSALQPASANEPGAVQYAWFAAGQAVMGAIGGGFVGAGFFSGSRNAP